MSNTQQRVLSELKYADGGLTRGELYDAVDGFKRKSDVSDCLRALRHEGPVTFDWDTGKFHYNHD